MFNIANLLGMFAFTGRKNVCMGELMLSNVFLPAAQKTLHRLGEVVDIGIMALIDPVGDVDGPLWQLLIFVPLTAKVVFPRWKLGKA